MTNTRTQQKSMKTSRNKYLVYTLERWHSTTAAVMCPATIKSSHFPRRIDTSVNADLLAEALRWSGQGSNLQFAQVSYSGSEAILAK